jgi:hypothetical protein
MLGGAYDGDGDAASVEEGAGHASERGEAPPAVGSDDDQVRVEQFAGWPPR